MADKPVYNNRRERLLNKDDKYFRKYIENTTAHGVVRIFSGKSYIRRLFWLVIVLGSAAGCLNNVINRFIFFAGSPTSTTLALTRQDNLTFPAVTVCNLNQFRRDAVDEIHPDFTYALRDVFYSGLLDNETLDSNCSLAEFVERENLPNLSLEELYFRAMDPFDELILDCFFAGKRCNRSHFTLTLTDIGYCYTFNSAEQNSSFKAISTGTRAGLYLAMSINQQLYVASNSFDAGVKVVVHPRSETPRPEDTGVAVPPGRNAFIGIRERRIIDNTARRQCRSSLDLSGFNFLGDEGEGYSISSCSYDCLLTRIAEECECTLDSTTSNERYEMLPVCTVSDLCCVLEQQRVTVDCQCPAACNSTAFDLFNSYSAFPAQYFAEDVETRFTHLYNFSFNTRDNILSVNVYFESLNVETQTTSDAYGPVALLSDIGGQLGLFMGVSVISVMEFVTWLIDEVKFRLCGESVSERTLCRCCSRLCSRKKKAKPETPNTVTVTVDDKELSTVPYVENKT